MGMTPRAERRLVERLRAALDRNEFAPPALETLFADGEAGAAAQLDTLEPQLATLLRLFVLGETVSASAADEALAPLGLDGAVTLRVATRNEDEVEPAVRLVPHDVLVLASDLPRRDPAPDHVAAAHAPSLALAQLTVRRPARTALDLGTGNGVQALMLATHARRVLATDANERALRFTELNAALNRRANIDVRASDFLEAVPEGPFDVVVCSPPYVISPASGVLYRNAPIRGDAVSERLVRTVPAILARGGFATLLVSWVANDDTPTPLGWLDGSECDAILIRLRRESVRETADHWLADEPEARREERVRNWLDFYRSQSIDAIGYGAIVLRKRDGADGRAVVDLPGGPGRHLGAEVEALFDRL